MSSRQKRKQARRNGAMAAGTKSPEGIKQSSMNALSHGLTAKALVLTNESQAAFDKLRLEYVTNGGEQTVTTRSRQTAKGPVMVDRVI